MIARRIFFLNLLLVAGLVFCANKLQTTWKAFEEDQNLASLVAVLATDPGTVEAVPQLATTESLVSHDFFVIAERDLFSPERRPKPVESTDEVVEEAPKFPKKPQMNGTTVIGGKPKALLTIFDTPKSQGEPQVVGIDDLVQGHSVTEITDTTVTLRWNDTETLIDMFDSEATASPVRVANKSASVNIIRIGSSHAAVETTQAGKEGEDGQRGAQPGSTRTQSGGLVPANLTSTSPARGADQGPARPTPSEVQRAPISGLLGYGSAGSREPVAPATRPPQ